MFIAEIKVSYDTEGVECPLVEILYYDIILYSCSLMAQHYA